MSNLYFLGFDTEDRGNHDPYLFALYGDICTITGGHHKGNETVKKIEHIDLLTEHIEDVLEVLNKRICDTYLIGFNLAYDLNNIFPQYNREQKHWKGKFAGFKDNTLKIKGIEMMGKWFQQIGMKDLAAKFGSEYIDEHKENSPHIREACRSHAKSIYEVTKALESLFNELGYSMNYARNYMPTASSMAFDIWKKIEQQDPQNWDKSLNLLAGFAYSGGWCDVFKNSLQTLAQHYDVVSMYPHVMWEEEYPDPNVKFTTGDPDKLFDYMSTKAGFAVGHITAPDILISPFSQRKDHKLIFPVGTWLTSITFPEIQYLYELGGSFKCSEVYYTDRWRPFKRYVEKFYTLKKDKKYKEVAKLFLNGLSGKFGQKVRPEGEYAEIDPAEIDSTGSNEFGIKTFYVCGKNYEYMKPTTTEVDYSYYPLMSAYITAYARIKLHRMMNKLGYENIIYCDTDSIIANSIIPDEFIAKDKELGKWEYEGKDVKIHAIAPKKYKEFRDKKWLLRANGIPKKLQHRFWRHPYKPVKYRQPLSFKQALRRHALPNQWVEVIKIHVPSFKREFAPDGTSKPYREIL